MVSAVRDERIAQRLEKSPAGCALLGCSRRSKLQMPLRALDRVPRATRRTERRTLGLLALVVGRSGNALPRAYGTFVRRTRPRARGRGAGPPRRGSRPAVAMAPPRSTLGGGVPLPGFDGDRSPDRSSATNGLLLLSIGSIRPYCPYCPYQLIRMANERWRHVVVQRTRSPPQAGGTSGTPRRQREQQFDNTRLSGNASLPDRQGSVGDKLRIEEYQDNTKCFLRVPEFNDLGRNPLLIDWLY